MEDDKKITSIEVVWDDDTTTEYDDVAGTAIVTELGDGFMQILNSNGDISGINLSYIRSYTVYKETVH